MRQISHKRESKKPKITQASGLYTPYVDDNPCSLSRCYDSIVDCHRKLAINLAADAVLRLPSLRFRLTKAQLQNLYEMQEGRCALTGLELRPCLYHEPERPDALGLDFIRSGLGYVKSNSRLVCWPLAIGRAVRGDIGVRAGRPYRPAEQEMVYTRYTMQTKILDRLPADDYLVRHSLMMIYVEHLRGSHALKYYPIMVVLDGGVITFKAYYFMPDQKRWDVNPRTRLEHTDFTRLFLDGRGDLLVARYEGNDADSCRIEYANPELDMCVAIDRAVVASFRAWYGQWAQSRD